MKLSSGHDTTIVLMNLQQLWLFTLDRADGWGVGEGGAKQPFSSMIKPLVVHCLFSSKEDPILTLSKNSN